MESESTVTLLAITLASAQELKVVTGKYFISSQKEPSSKASYDEQLARAL
ncbi:MAG TPA: hypothetical protein VNA24_23905 [Hyalangium sp.]|jgi:hypothetical protein|nr:hypothetical protein [Hyalangium sp.]